MITGNNAPLKSDAGNEPKKKRRGFASMPLEKQREISAKGGRAAQQKGVAHRWTTEEARTAGRKGGNAHRDRHPPADSTMEQRFVAGTENDEADN